MPHIIVEYVFDPPMTEEEFDAMAERLDPCLDARSVRWVQSFVARDRTRRICIFEAPDAASVRAAYGSAGVGFARAWAADVIDGDDGDDSD
jgi:hypothetical protein